MFVFPHCKAGGGITKLPRKTLPCLLKFGRVAEQFVGLLKAAEPRPFKEESVVAVMAPSAGIQQLTELGTP